MQQLGIWEEINGVETAIVQVPNGNLQSGVPYRIRFQCFQDGNVTVLIGTQSRYAVYVSAVWASAGPVAMANVRASAKIVVIFMRLMCARAIGAVKQRRSPALAAGGSSWP